MGLWRGEYQGNAIGWNSPIQGPVNPAFVRAGERGGLGWLGGFDECIVRCGLESNGSPGTDIVPNNMEGRRNDAQPSWPDRQLSRRASWLLRSGRQSPELSITGIVTSYALLSAVELVTRISSRLGSNAFTISDRSSISRVPRARCRFSNHCNFGAPFMDEGATL